MKIKLAVAVAALVALGLSVGSGSLHAQLPVPPSSQFDLTGFLQEAKLDPACTLSKNCGGTLKVNGHVVVVPKETIVILPANALSWQELFAQAPAPYGLGAATPSTGLALADSPKPRTTFEVHVVGNRVLGGPGGADVYIAGLINVAQQDLNSGAGYINFMDYNSGEMRVGGTLGDSTTGARVKINDPLGRFGRASSPDPRFGVDPDNPTVSAGTGFPMCFPRVAPPPPGGAETDALCPQGNRPKDLTGAFIPAVQMLDPTVFPGVFPDATKQAPLEVGDYVTFAGTLMTDGNGDYVSAHTVGNNIAIYTWPGTNPAYVAVEVSLIGTGGLTVAGAGEAVIRTRFEGMSTDPTRNVHLYGIDLDPLTGATSDRDWGTIGVDPGPPNGAVKGRWRFRPPCVAAVATDKACTPPPGGTFLPPTREMRAVVEGLQGQVPGSPGAITTANGIYFGQYHAPIQEFIFPENVPGTAIPENNFNTIDFLAKGGYSSSTGFVAGQLSPWPSNVPPAGACQAPVVSAGGPYTVASGGSVTLGGSATGTAPFTYQWAPTAVGSLSNVSIASPVFTAPVVGVQTPVALSLTVSNACGSQTVGGTVTINAAAAPTVAASSAPSGSAFSGTLVTLNAVGVDPSGLPLTYRWTQTAGRAVLVPNPANGQSVTFTDTLPVGQTTSDVLNFNVVATNSVGVSSAAAFVSITVNPLPDSVLITTAEYRTSKQRLVITATTSVISANVVLKLKPYITVSGTTFDPATLGNTFTNNGGGLYTLQLVGAPEPAVPPATPLIAFSNIGGQSLPTALTLIRN